MNTSEDRQGRILLFQIKLMAMLRQKNGLQEKLELLISKRDLKNGFFPPHELKSLMSIIIASGNAGYLSRSYAMKALLTMTTHKFYRFIIDEEDRAVLTMT